MSLVNVARLITCRVEYIKLISSIIFLCYMYINYLIGNYCYPWWLSHVLRASNTMPAIISRLSSCRIKLNKTVSLEKQRYKYTYIEIQVCSRIYWHATPAIRTRRHADVTPSHIYTCVPCRYGFWHSMPWLWPSLFHYMVGDIVV